MNIKILCTLFLILGTLFVKAQETPIETDRPDQTETAATVPKHWMQFESGLSKTKYRDKQGYKEEYFDHPTLLTKYGLGQRFELRLITVWSTERDRAFNAVETFSGISDAELGAKGNICEQKGWRPKISLIAHYSFGQLRTLYTDTLDGANFRFVIQRNFGKQFSIGTNIGMEWELFGYPPAYVYTFSPGYTFDDRWYAFIEAYGFIWKDYAPQNSVDGGVAYNLNENIKVDAAAGFRISKRAPNSYFSLGLSLRFKTKK
ncbi:MAG: transporter [Bacteroidetes bacterium]|nr:transporter [Bacteroidota bacterium]